MAATLGPLGGDVPHEQVVLPPSMGDGIGDLGTRGQARDTPLAAEYRLIQQPYEGMQLETFGFQTGTESKRPRQGIGPVNHCKSTSTLWDACGSADPGRIHPLLCSLVSVSWKNKSRALAHSKH